MRGFCQFGRKGANMMRSSAPRSSMQSSVRWNASASASPFAQLRAKQKACFSATLPASFLKQQQQSAAASFSRSFAATQHQQAAFATTATPGGGVAAASSTSSSLSSSTSTSSSSNSASTTEAAGGASAGSSVSGDGDEVSDKSKGLIGTLFASLAKSSALKTGHYSEKYSQAVVIAPKTEMTVLEQFVNNLMKNGEKRKARTQLAEALNHLRELIAKHNAKLEETNSIKSRLPDNPTEALLDAIELVSPLMRLVSERRGAKNKVTPRPLHDRRRRRTGIVWIIDAATKRGHKTPFPERLGQEVYKVLTGESAAIQKRVNLHKSALQNRGNVVVDYGRP